MRKKTSSQATGRKPLKCWIHNAMQKYILTQRTENTVRKTEYDLNVWKRLFLEVGVKRKIEDIPANELNILICRFIMERKKKNGGAYEPATLQSFQRSLQRYLNDKNSKKDILKDRWFQVFFRKRNNWLLKKPKVIVPMPRKNYPMLKIRSGQFGDGNLAALQRTVWWLFALHLDSVPETKAENLNGETLFFKKTAPETGNEVLIWRSERGRAVVMVIHGHFILLPRQQTLLLLLHEIQKSPSSWQPLLLRHQLLKKTRQQHLVLENTTRQERDW